MRLILTMEDGRFLLKKKRFTHKKRPFKKLWKSRVYRDIYDQLKREFGIYADDGKPRSYKALQRKYLYDAHELIDAYEPPIYIQEMIDNANSQIRLGDISGTLSRDTCNMDNP